MEEQARPDILRRFGLGVKRRRQELHISQEELAERAELYRTYVSDVERGSRNVSLEPLLRGLVDVMG